MIEFDTFQVTEAEKMIQRETRGIYFSSRAIESIFEQKSRGKKKPRMLFSPQEQHGQF